MKLRLGPATCQLQLIGTLRLAQPQSQQTGRLFTEVVFSLLQETRAQQQQGLQHAITSSRLVIDVEVVLPHT